MADNVPMPKNYRRGRDKAMVTCESVLRDMIAEAKATGRIETGNAERVAMEDVLQSLAFYRVRCEKMHEAFPCIPSSDPARQIISEILANGYSMKAGQRP